MGLLDIIYRELVPEQLINTRTIFRFRYERLSSYLDVGTKIEDQ